GPGEPLAVDDENRLDRLPAFERLDETVFADERLVLRAVGADDGPIRLLAEEVAGVCAASRGFGDDRVEVVFRRRPRRRLDDYFLHVAVGVVGSGCSVGNPDERGIATELV